MKKLIVGFLCIGALASCNVKNSDEYKALQMQNDSIMRANAAGASEVSELMSVINEVESNFAQIREAEKYLSLESKTKGEMSGNTKTKVADNFQMINEILKKNKADLAILNKRLANSTGEVAALKKTLDRLNLELEERAASIVELQRMLASRDEKIAHLTSDIKDLASNVDHLATQTAEQASTIKEQDKALNTAYYIFGTSNELKEAKVVTGGFISSPKLLKESIDKSIFIKIDIRDVTAIPLYAKKAKILSDHPKASYSLEKDASGQIVIKINDYKKFWSLTQFLVAQVN